MTGKPLPLPVNDDLFPEPVDHHCLGCGKVHQDARTVTLHDGRVVSTYSEAFREECEAISILDIPDRNHRNVALGKVRDRRGKEAAERLEVLCRTIWNIRLALQRAVG